MTMIEMNVNMDCGGCESKIRKALLKLDGVDDVEIDMDMQKVTVTGSADQTEVLKTVRKSGKRAELWSYPNNNEYHSFNNHYNTNNYYTRKLNNYHNQQDDYDDHGHKNDYYSLSSQSSNYEDDHYYQQPTSDAHVSRYSYREHGYNGHDHGYYHQPPHLTMFNEKSSNLFSDDNPHACSIM